MGSIFVSVDEPRRKVRGGVTQLVVPGGTGKKVRVFGPFDSWSEADQWMEEFDLAPHEAIAFHVNEPSVPEKEYEVEMDVVVTVKVTAEDEAEAEDLAFEQVEDELFGACSSAYAKTDIRIREV